MDSTIPRPDLIRIHDELSRVLTAMETGEYDLAPDEIYDVLVEAQRLTSDLLG